MPVITGVSTSLRRPQTFHSFVYLQGGRSLVPLPQKLVVIGTQKGGTGVAGTVYGPLSDPQETDGLFGIGTPLALMLRKAYETSGFLGAGPYIYAVPVDEPAAGAARTQTWTLTGPATASGNLVIRIAGRTITVGIASGDAAATIATALKAALDALKTTLPVSAAVAAAVVTTTHNAKGVGGNDVVFEVVSAPAGVTCVTAQGVAGAGTADETAALAAIAGVDYDAIALENHLTADVALALAHVTAAWTAEEKKWRWILLGEPGSSGTATTLAAASNDRAISVLNVATPSLPGELAAAGGVALLSRSRPNGNWDGMKIPIYPPYDAADYTNTQIEALLAAGVTPLKAVSDPSTRVQQPGVVRIEKFVTTATTLDGEPFEALRDIAVPRTGAFIARQIDAKFAERFGADANPDGVLETDDTVDQVRDMVANILYAAQDAKILTNVDNDLALLVVEKDPDAPGRINVDVTYTVVLGLHQVAFVHRVTI